MISNISGAFWIATQMDPHENEMVCQKEWDKIEPKCCNKTNYLSKIKYHYFGVWMFFFYNCMASIIYLSESESEYFIDPGGKSSASLSIHS